MKKIMLGIVVLLSFCNISFAAYNGGQWFPIYDNPEGAYYLNMQYIKCFKTEHELINFWTMVYSQKNRLKNKSLCNRRPLLWIRISKKDCYHSTRWQNNVNGRSVRTMASDRL